MSNVISPNPGLAPFELSHYKGLANRNFYEMHPVLREFIQSCFSGEHASDVDQHLSSFGELAGGKLNDLVIAAHKEGKYGKLVKYDRHGNRIDDIEYSPEQQEVRRLAYEAGIVNLDCHPDWKHEFAYEHREALAYIANMNGESGYTCPLAMTEGAIEILRNHGSEKAKERFLPLLTAPDSKSYFMAGQYLTERVGGSNVGANRTVARKGDDGKWYLTGEKWFCSNPGDFWVTTARIEGSEFIGAFMVGRYKEDGSLNDHHILRLKDIIGSRGKVTAEVEYRGVEAEMIGRPHTGLALVMRHVIAVSRVHTGLGACAGGRRAFWEAREYTKNREAFKQKIGKFRSIRRNLALMQLEITSVESLIFYNWTLRYRNAALFELLTPLLKYSATMRAAKVAHEAILIHGGNGILADYSVLPRLLNDGIINETWEGTHQIIAGHVLKAFGRNRCRNALFEFVESTLNLAQVEYKPAIEFAETLKDNLLQMKTSEIDEANSLPVCDMIFNLMAQCIFLKNAANQDLTTNWRVFALVWPEYCKNGYQGFYAPNSFLMQDDTLQELIEAT